MATARQLEEAAELARRAEEAESAAALREEEARKLTEAARQERLSADQKRAAADASHAAADGSTLGSGTDDLRWRDVGTTGAGAGGPPLRAMPAIVAEPPWWNRSEWTIVAIIALIIALIALGWLALNRDNWSTLKQGMGAAVMTAKNADEKADKALSLGEANGKATKEHDGRITQAQQTADDALAKVKDCGCDKKEQPKAPAAKKPHQSAAKPAPAPVSPPKAHAPALAAPLPATALKPGGCIYVSDGAAILKGTTVRQPAGTELARISDEGLRASPVPEIRSILQSHPKAFVTDQGHLSMCNAWSNYVAVSVQIPEGRRVNNDTHRVSN